MENHYLRSAVIRSPFYHIVLLCLLLFGFTVIGPDQSSLHAQGVELDDFSVFQHGEDIYLSWVIAKGNTCNGISIERSSDNIAFEEINYIPGICGNAAYPQPYSFVDAHPLKNQVNFYRLELGLQGYSETRSVEYLYVENDGFQIRPNPAVDRVLLMFENTNRREHSVQIYSLRGELILEQTTNNSVFDLEISDIPAGVYPIRITNKYNGGATSQRLIIR